MAAYCQPNTVAERILFESNSSIKIQLIKADDAQAMIKDFLVFRAMTSIANKNPASGLVNKMATPATTPAQINSRLYILAENSFSYA